MKKLFSLRYKVVIGIVVMALAIGGVLTCVSYFRYRETMNTHYETWGNKIAYTAVSFLDEEQVATLVDGLSSETTNFDAVMETTEYQATKADLRTIMESTGVSYLYVIHPTAEGFYYIFDADADESDDFCPYGYFMEYDKGGFHTISDDLIAGNYVPAVISEDEYGWVMSICYPYFHSDGEALAYVCVDISMGEVVFDQRVFLGHIIWSAVAVTAAFAILYAIVCDLLFVKPIKKMSKAADHFVSGGEGGELAATMNRLSVKGHDELGVLCTSLKKMEQDILSYIENLRTVTAEKERIGAELSVAAQIQSSMLPCIFPAFPDRKEFDIYASMDPAKEVGGDFYDFFMVDETHLGIVIADVSGKGVPAALFMVIGKTLLKDHTTPGCDIAKVFQEVNDLLCESNSEGLFITAFEGVLDLATGELRYVNAGHEMPFLCKNGIFAAQKIKPYFVLAGMEGVKYKAGSFFLEPGDKIFQYTDGVTEAVDIDQTMYGKERLGEVLNDNSSASPEQIIRAVQSDLSVFCNGAPQADDITMLCLEYKGSVEESVSEERSFEAKIENIGMAIDFVNSKLDATACPAKARNEIDLAIDELFANVAQYAYPSECGTITIHLDIKPDRVLLTLTDSGVPYDPLAKPDPDITLSAEERKIGGLGIYMVKKVMDEIEYEYKNGNNIVRLMKKF